MPLFAIATLMPTLLIALGVFWGGAAAALGLLYMTVFVAVLDRFVARAVINPDPEAEFPGSDALLALLGVLHLVLLVFVVWAVAGDSGLGTIERLLIGIAGGLTFGQISHPVAHELIHKRPRMLRRLGRVVYTSLLVGHHASAHLRVHHVLVASAADPNSPPLGEGFYRYALRAAPGSFRAGMAAETAMMARGDRPAWRHPYLLYVGGGVTSIAAAALTFGWRGVLSYVALCLYAQIQILLSDYVQHYGLRRQLRDDGTLEPVGPRHSWNAPHWFSSALTLNAPRHSDHHVTPSRAYPGLQLDPAGMPMLPRPLPVMATIALIPSLWRRIMDDRARRWA